MSSGARDDEPGDAASLEAIAAEVLASFADGVLVVDPASRIVWMNPAAERLTGVSEGRGRSSPVGELFAANPEVVRLVERAMETQGSTADQFVTLERSSGPAVPVAAVASPWLDASGSPRGVSLVLRDRRPSRNIEEVTLRGDRRAMVEALGLGLAHELRNPLGGIKGAAQLLQRRLEGGRDAEECLEVIVGEVERLDALVRSVLELGRSGLGPRESVNIHLLLDEVLAVHRADPAAAGIRFKGRFDPSLPEVSADVADLKRVFHNLLRNAIEAVEAGGTITIHTSVSKDFSRVRKGSRASRFLEVDVEDDGPGIPEELRSQVFTPLYTTKPHGTGLGLPMALKIVEDHGGFLRVSACEPHGTRIEVYLPFDEADARGQRGES